MRTQTSLTINDHAWNLRKVVFKACIVIAGACIPALIVVAPTNAASSSTINFQARLESSSGAIAPDGAYNVEFKLYNVSTSSGSSQGSCTGDANCLWVETRTATNQVRVANGYLTVNLGSVTAFGSINWNQQLWLTIRIGGTGGTPSWDTEMSPRLQLTAVPYAFQAGALSQTDGSGNTGTLKFNTTATNPAITLPDATGTVCLQNSSACGFATGSGIAFIQGGNSFGSQGELGTNDAYSLAFKTNSADKLILDTSGNLTLQQASTLKIVSAATGTNLTIQGGAATTPNNAGGDLLLKGGAGAGTGNSGSVIVRSNGNNSTTAFQVQNTGGNDVLTVDTSNSIVVLGQASATNAALVLQNSTNANTITLQSGITTGSYTLTLPTAVSGTSGSCLKDTTGAGALGWGACGGAGAGGVSLQATTPGTPDTGNFNVSGTGIVGTALYVNGVGQFSGSTQIGTVSQGFFGDGTNLALRTYNVTNSGVYLQSYNGTSTVLYAGTSGTYAGNVGIGTTSPVHPLVVRGASGSSSTAELSVTDGTQWVTLASNMSAGAFNGLTSAGNQGIVFSNGTGNTGKFEIVPWSSCSSGCGLVVDSSGRVGIGTAAPSYPLEVNGVIQADNNWIYTTGSTGWYNATYGGGWNMQDTTWIRNYNSKPVYLYGNGSVSLATGNGNVGIGTTSPNSILDVAGGPIHVSGAVISSVSSGQGAYLNWNATGGSGETDFINNQGGGGGGFNWYNTPSGGSFTPGDPIMSLGSNGQLNIGNSNTTTHSAIAMYPNGVNAWFYMDNPNNNTLRFSDGTSVGAHFDMSVNSNATITVNGTNYSSDERLKTNIQDLGGDQGLSSIMQLNPVSFNWKSTSADPNTQLGFIAQQVQQVFPNLVESQDTSETITLADGSTQTIVNPLSVTYTGLIAPLVKSVQELDAAQVAQAAQIATLQANTSFTSLNVSGLAMIDSLTVMNDATFKANITVDGHIVTAGGTPTATALVAAGIDSQGVSDATCSVTGDDTSGVIRISTGAIEVSSGPECTITFAQPFAASPHPVPAAVDRNSAIMGVYVAATSTNMTISFAQTPAAYTTYTFNFQNLQ